jgi:uncharacterized membrane protein
MRALFCVPFFMLTFAAAVDAQAARPVLLEACNDAPFAIGIAAAYRNDPTDRRVVQGWFEVAPGDCLEGGLGDIVGEEIWLGAASGSWRWPDAGQADVEYCTPAQTFFGLARSGDCDDVERLTGFERVAISPFRSGWGRVRIRYSCDDFPSGDAALCRQTQTGSDGLAVPVNHLEVCNTWPVDAEVTAGASTDFVGFEVSGWVRIPPTLCRIVYRGFPAGGEVWFASRIAQSREIVPAHEGNLCVTEGNATASGPRGSFVNAGQCPADAPISAGAERVRFGPNVERFQAYVPRRSR